MVVIDPNQSYDRASIAKLLGITPAEVDNRWALWTAVGQGQGLAKGRLQFAQTNLGKVSTGNELIDHCNRMGIAVGQPQPVVNQPAKTDTPNQDDKKE